MMTPTLTPPQQFTARLADRQIYNESFQQLHFELTGQPNELHFKAGQYVSIQVNERGERRSYSITSSPEVSHGFELLVDISPQGLGSQYLAGLQLGEEISFLAPLGRFTLTPETTGHSNPVVMIATGSGIAPFKAMLHELLQLKFDRLAERETVGDTPLSLLPPRDITLHWGMRYAENLFWLDEFQEFMDSFSQFHFNPTLSKPTADWTLSRGRVTEVLQLSSFDLSADYYLCGNQEMIEAVVALLSGKGIPDNQIHFEKFY